MAQRGNLCLLFLCVYVCVFFFVHLISWCLCVCVCVFFHIKIDVRFLGESVVDAAKSKKKERIIPQNWDDPSPERPSVVPGPRRETKAQVAKANRQAHVLEKAADIALASDPTARLEKRIHNQIAVEAADAENAASLFATNNAGSNGSATCQSERKFAALIDLPFTNSHSVRAVDDSVLDSSDETAWIQFAEFVIKRVDTAAPDTVSFYCF